MSLFLCTSAGLESPAHFDRWLVAGSIDHDKIPLPAELQVPDVASMLEEAFVAARDTWWRLGRLLSGQPTGELSHACACGSVGSDFGIMLAWDGLVRRLAEEKPRTMVICDDPWLFRQLAGIQGAEFVTAPGILISECTQRIRGFCARVRLGIRNARAAVWLRRFRSNPESGASALLVYGHPGSDGAGRDAYFGDMLVRFPLLQRVLHVDCDISRSEELCRHDRTSSLHAWGSPFAAVFRLPLIRWSPQRSPESEPFYWLIRRAACLENGGGGLAMTWWQSHCQERWLRRIRPAAVAWPWENFAWERALVRSARSLGTATTGYQHTVVGPHQFNYSVRCNPDGLESVPDIIAANGPAYRKELISWGLPEDRVVDAGSIRLPLPEQVPEHDPSAPIFMALSANLPVAIRQVDVARRLAAAGIVTLVKEHPMYPVSFEETSNLRRTETALIDHKSLSTVIYCTGSTAIDSLIAGIPCIRLRFPDRISIDVLPTGVGTTVAEEDNLVALLKCRRSSPRIRWEEIFSKPDEAVWCEILKIGAPQAQ